MAGNTDRFVQAVDEIIEDKRENSEWEPDEMRAAVYEKENGKSYNKAVEERDFGVSSLQHVYDAVKERRQELEVEAGDDDDGETPDVFVSELDRAIEGFRGVFEELNEKYDFGIKETPIDMMCDDIRAEGELPTEQQVWQFLNKYDSGVNNNAKLNYIGKRYSGWLKQYHEQQGRSQPTGGFGSGFDIGEGGGEPSMGSGEGIPVGGGSDGVSGGGIPIAGDGEGQGQGGGNRQMMQMMQMMQQQMQDQQERMMERVERMMESQDNGGGGSFKEELADFLQTQQQLQEMMGGGQDEHTQRMLATLQQELQDLKEGGTGGGIGELDLGGANSNIGALALALQSGALEGSELLEFAKEIGGVESDPEVKKKELEKEIELKKEQMSNDRWDSIIETFEGGADGLSNALMVLAGEAQNGEPDRARPQTERVREAQRSDEAVEVVEAVEETTSPVRDEMVADLADEEAVDEEAADDEQETLVTVGDPPETGTPVGGEQPEELEAEAELVDDETLRMDVDPEEAEVLQEEFGDEVAVVEDEAGDEADDEPEVHECPHCEFVTEHLGGLKSHIRHRHDENEGE